ncbi:inactive serine protease 54 [Dipodomys spectabilis]|uniref:inactive serine protease 54 n=1 Tax=Dipodomys spectabilis TaxID=105255 RepID=UPI001C535F19|nr:inactive serine protease 54 [Dipodomys spectabilis]
MAELRGMLLVLLYVSHTAAKCGIQKATLVDKSEENLVSITEFPWVVSLQDAQYTHLAFGCILSNFWILSAASALHNRKNVIAVVGIANMDPKMVSHTEYPINVIIIHEDFDNHSMIHNIALLRTDSAMHFDDLVQSICFLSRKLHLPPGLHNCWVSGWNPTSATGNHMTMSILRRISVKDLDPCPLHKPRKTGCGSHTEQETDTVCLGEPGNPMMCQLQEFDLWVLRGLLTPGGDQCPGLFLYTKVEDYSDWIMSKARKAGPSLFSLHPWEKLIPATYHQPSALFPLSTFPPAPHPVAWSHSQEPDRTTVYSVPANGSGDSSQAFKVKGIQDADRHSEGASQPVYYDYYGGEAGEETTAGQSRLRQPQAMSFVFSVLVFFGSGA